MGTSVKLIENAKKRSISGTWFADVAVTQGETALAMLHGLIGSRNLFTLFPRLQNCDLRSPISKKSTTWNPKEAYKIINSKPISCYYHPMHSALGLEMDTNKNMSIFLSMQSGTVAKTYLSLVGCIPYKKGRGKGFVWFPHNPSGEKKSPIGNNTALVSIFSSRCASS